jgi:hypothetical protein
MNGINLIPSYRIEARQRRRRVRAWVVASGCYGVVALAACLTVITAWGNPDRAVTDELGRVTRQVGEATAQLATLGPELTEAKIQLDASRAVSVQPDWSLLLGLLGKLLGETVVLTNVQLTPAAPVVTVPKEITSSKRLGLAAPADEADGTGKPKAKRSKPAAEEEQARKLLSFKMTIEGVAESQPEVSQFVLRLEQVKLFDQVKLVETSRTTLNGQTAAAFRVECSMAEQPRRAEPAKKPAEGTGTRS